ncbi:MAG: hypothetical protein U0325_21265 [Polyangiales bacterium]
MRDPRGWFARHINALAREGDARWGGVHPGAVVRTEVGERRRVAKIRPRGVTDRLART